MLPSILPHLLLQTLQSIPQSTSGYSTRNNWNHSLNPPQRGTNHHLPGYWLGGGTHPQQGSPMNTTYLPGTLVTNLGTNSRSKLFSSPLTAMGNHIYIGSLSGVGMVLEQHGSDVRITCDGNVGWCFAGNLRVVE